MALPTYRDIVDLMKKGATLEAQERILQLREGALELQEENIRLRDVVRELEARLKVKGQIEWDGIAYYLASEGKKEGPFCQRCYDVDSKLVRLQIWDGVTYGCFACKMNYDRSRNK